MGKSTPRAPAPPDPVAISQAQSQSNIATAQEQQRLNMVGSQGPTGSVLWQTDATQPGGYTQVTQLSPEQQQLYNQSMGAQNAALGLATQQIGRVGDALGQGFSYENLPGLVGSVTPQNATASQINAGQVVSPYGQGGFNVADYLSGSPNFAQLAAQYMPGLQGGGGGGLPTGGSLSLPAAQQGVSSVGPFGPIQSSVALQSGFDPGQAVQGQIGPQGPIQQSVAGGGPIQSQLGSYGQVQGQVGPTDFTADRNAVTDAVFQQMMSRLNPQWDQREAQMRARLAAQGFSSANSQGYQNSYDTYSRARNDAEAVAMLQAIQQGAAEQNQLFGQSLAQGQFANTAQNQAYQQALGSGQFANAAQGQQFAQGLAQGEFANTAQNQGYLQSLGAGQFANDAAAQQYAQNQGLAAFGNNAALASGEFANQAQNQGAQQQLSQGQLANQAAQIANSYNLGVGGLQVQNQGQQQQAALQQQQLAQQAAQYLGSLAYNQWQQTGAMGMDANAQANAAQNQLFGQGLARQQLLNSTAAQNFNQNLAAAQFQNQARTQGAQELAYEQNLPLQQFATLMGSGQVTMPEGIGYSPSSIAPTDVLGAYALNNQAQQANYQAQMRAQSGLMGGLFGLGSALLTAPMTSGGSLIGTMLGSERLTKADIIPIGEWKGLRVYSYRYKGDTTPRVGVMADEAVVLFPRAVKRVGNMVAVDYGELARAA